MSIRENANTVAQRIAGLFDAVYGLGNQQYSVLHRAVMKGLKREYELLKTLDAALAEQIGSLFF